MAKIIEAKAIISGEEKLSPILDKLAKKLAQIEKNAKTGQAVEKTATAMSRVNKQLAAMEKFNASTLGIGGARENFNRAKIAVENAARAMRTGQGDARKLEQEYRRAQVAVSSASRAFDHQRTAVLGASRALAGMGVPAGRIVAEQKRIAAAVTSANAALERQNRHGGRARAAIGSAVGNLGYLTGPGVLHGTKAAVESGAHIQSEIVKMRAAGIPEVDIQRELGTSAGLAAKYTNVKRSDILERYKELRSVLLHPEEASHLLDPTIRANAALNAVDRTGHMAEGLQFAVKGAEVLGLAQDPKRFTAYLDAFVKAQQVMGKTITPEQMFEFAKYTKASGTTLSDRFKFTTGVSLSQELGGSTTGVSIDQFVKQITGGFQGNLHTAAKEFVALGLANKDDFETTKTGSIKGMKSGRHVKGADVAQTDPDRYVYDYLLPALEKAGFKDQNSQIAQVRRMFPSTRAADLVSKLISQRYSFENHAKLYEKAQGLNAIDTNQTDPFVALNSLTTSLSNFAGTVTSPMMENTAGALSNMASGIANWGNSLSVWQKNNPMAAQIAGGAAVVGGIGAGGVLTYGLISNLMSGFGLAGSAVALDGSAAALTAAAAALGGGSVVQKVVGGATGATAGGWGFAKALPYIKSGLPYAGPVGLGLGLAGGVVAIYDSTRQYEGMTAGERLRQQRGGSMNDAYRRAFNDDRDRLGIPLLGESGKIEAELKGHAEVKGEARVTIDIPGLKSIGVNVPLSGTVNANGPGSLGVSSPDAGAHPIGP